MDQTVKDYRELSEKREKIRVSATILIEQIGVVSKDILGKADT